MNLADNLKRIRKEHNLSQEQLAEELGVSRQSVSKWESGQAYPEMDKVLQLCKLFDVNIDELLNQNIKEVTKAKQSKININKYIDDFLDYITKTVDMFSSLKWKEKIKCVVEQIIIVCCLTLIFVIIGSIGLVVADNILCFLPHQLYQIILNILAAIYLIISLILVIMLLFHIFKIRYLDYYIIVKEDNDVQEKKVIEETLEPQKIYLEKKKEKIVIRDPKHAGYRFITGLIRCSIFFIKIIMACIGLGFCFSLVGFILCFAVSFLFIQTGLAFIGVVVGLLACILTNIIILEIIYNFIINKKINKTKVGIVILSSLISVGVGIGLFIIGFTSFDRVSDTSSKYFIEDSYTYDMLDDSYIHDFWNDNIEYIESDNENVKIVIKHHKNSQIVFHENMYYSFVPIDFNDFKMMRNIIEDINHKKIIDYSKTNIYVYTTKENIEKLKQNKQKVIDDYYQEYYNEEKEELENQIESLEGYIDELETRLQSEEG